MNYLHEQAELEQKFQKKYEYSNKQINTLNNLISENNLLIIGDSQKGKTTLLNKILSNRVGERILLIDGYDEVYAPDAVTVKYKNGFYKLDYNNEVSTFAIKSALTKEQNLIVYDDFYGIEIENIIDFLSAHNGRRLIATINHPKAEAGLKMILKRIYNNSQIPYSKLDIDRVQKYFKNILHLGDIPTLYDVKTLGDEVFLVRKPF